MCQLGHRGQSDRKRVVSRTVQLSIYAIIALYGYLDRRQVYINFVLILSAFT